MLENTQSKAVSLKYSCQPILSLVLLKGGRDGKSVIRGNGFLYCFTHNLGFKALKFGLC